MKNLSVIKRAHPYKGREIAIGTKHKKEKVMRPQFLMQLGASLVVPQEIDTDTLGTFSGEVKRPGTPCDVAVKKAEWAMSLTGLLLGVANEGSFGPHPQIGFIPSDSEWMVFVDQERDFKIVERSITTKTNFGHITVKKLSQAKEFLENSLFPTHGVIVRPHAGENVQNCLFKGIISLPELEAAVKTCANKSSDGMAQIETDMRAHMNPTRLFAIQMLAQKLGKRLRQLCDSCGTLGWGIVETVGGLPCEICEEPTGMFKQERYGCAKCDAFQLCDRPDRLEVAKALYCNRCNP